MLITNKTRVWGGKSVNARRLSGLMIASGGIKLTGRTLADDYGEDFRSLRVPALVNGITGRNIEDMYADMVGAGWIYPMPEDAHRDPAAYLLDALLSERHGPSILTDADPEQQFISRRRRAGRIFC